MVSRTARGEAWSKSSFLKLPCSGKPSLHRAAVAMKPPGATIWAAADMPLTVW